MENMPKHIVILPDGNRRWARERGLDTLEGHKAGYEKLTALCKWAKAKGVEVITAFGFSTENWNRTEREVSYLMGLLEKRLKEGLRELQNEGVQIRVIGQKERLSESLRQVIAKAEEATKENKLVLNLAISYGGRWDITQAVRRMMAENVAADEVTEEKLNAYLSTGDLPDPDLFIRAGGEQRLSNLVLWQAAYAELYFCPKYWPDFSKEDFEEALAEYARRQRRFGK